MGGQCCIRCKTEGPNLKNRSFSWRKITAWSMIDFSNSIVIMVIMGQYTTFITNYVYLDRDQSIDHLMYANIVVSVITFIISPPIGALIDRFYIRVPILVISIIGYSVFSMAMYSVNRGDSAKPISFYALCVFFFRLNEMVAGAFLPALANERDVGFVSGYGYFVGFVSGIVITLVTKLFTTPDPNLTKEEKAAFTISGYKTATLVVGIVELLSGVSPMLMLDNGLPKGEKREKFTGKAIGDSFVENARTFRTAFSVNKVLTCILISYFFVSISVQSFSSFGANTFVLYGMDKYGVDHVTLQNAGLFYNGCVAVFSLVYAVLARYVSAYWLVMVCYILVIVGCVPSFVYPALEGSKANPGQFWIWTTFALFGISSGPLQALMRGSIGQLTPKEKKGEIFGCLESIITIGAVLGSTIPGIFVKMSPQVFFGWNIAWAVVGCVIWLCLPIRRAEREAIERLKTQEAQEQAQEVLVEAVVEKSASTPSPSAPSASYSVSRSEQ